MAERHMVDQKRVTENFLCMQGFETCENGVLELRGTPPAPWVSEESLAQTLRPRALLLSA